ncbi:uncharacterized protein LOC131307071 [Rhododendron vialii]|uniref:uncharacterized protein LOC131307071 n=1 Tax=Rhododendron vialii TaxID=182163 RepID=UPI00265D6CAB|nr:uncharacterized protein LOC131307071 [Rhododendron vialii]
MNLPGMQKLLLRDDKERVVLNAETEALLHIATVWWAEGTSMKIKINEAIGGDQYRYHVKLHPLWKPPAYRMRILRLLDLGNRFSLDDNFLMPSFNILLWNCRGAGNDNFKHHFSELVRMHKLEIVGLLETKITFRKMGLFFKNLGFSGSAYVNPNGRAGGIWLVWDTSKVSKNITHASSQAIHSEITKDGFEDWVLTTAYASPNPKNREIMWEDMEVQAHSNNKPWLVAGDLNDTLNSSEGRSFSVDTNSSQRRRFADHVNNCNLVDLGFSGPKFTWNNGRKGMANVQKRLDRALCNEEWRNLFPEGHLKLNTDGCFYESTNTAGFRGVIRDSSGNWILGYYGKATCTSSLEVEIWAIYRGLTIILEKGMSNVTIEFDSSVAVGFYNEGPPVDHPHRHVVEEARRIAAWTNSSVVHIYRQANQTADCLARLGSQQNQNLVVSSSIPFAVREFALADAMGVGHLRI